MPPPLLQRLEHLTPDQRAAALATPGPILCVAPAGSGKTTTVVARIAWRIVRGTPTEAVCALTFNRRAADELRERVEAALSELGIGGRGVKVRTFHALGREILAEAGIDVTAIAERAELVEAVLGGPPPADVARHLDDAFSRLKLDPEVAESDPGIDPWTVQAFQAYQDELGRRRALDLDDLVARATPTLRAEAGLLARWQARCATLFVDEAQDLDRAQLELVLALAGERRDVFLVGDDDQTIYAWRLADVRRILGLAGRLPGLVRVDLATNHRCPPDVVARASRLIAHNEERFEKAIGASPRATGELVLAPDPGDDVARARRLFDAWWPDGAAGSPPPAGSRAILARTNRELGPYAAVALERGIPHRIEEGTSLLGGAEIGRLLEVAQAFASDPRHVGSIHPFLAIEAAAVALGAPAELTSALLAWAPAYPDIRSLVEAIAAATEAQRALRRDDAALSLATVHGTKGLEWDHVACVGFDADRFPSARTLAEAPDPHRALEEERRLAYVAWTRARRSLTIVYDPFAPSVFMPEAFDPAELQTA